MNRLLLVLGTACATAPTADPALDALAPWPDDPSALWQRCAQETFEELATTCRVQAAANFGAAGDSKSAEAVCTEVPEGTWREECHFRAGEELGHAGLAVEGLRHCAQAGWFGRNCLTHTAWRLPRDTAVHPGLPTAQIAANYAELDEQVEQALAGAEDGVAGEGRDIMRARFGFNVYVGSGQTNPEPARLPDPLGPALRTGFAIETARLLGDTASVEAILEVWSGERTPPGGAAVAAPDLNGRYSLPLVAPQEHGIPHTPVFGGGLRSIGTTPDEDATIAALEGMFWLESTNAETFLPWVEDPRKRVRRTATRLLSRTQPASIDLPGVLQRLSKNPDPAVRWHAAQGLKSRAWEAPAMRSSAED
ncbi:MAG: hypothetical protein CL927_05210 [Deltaproteobacteria bacterium]|nr:hypothetical protein [Deltaproteobacteria bacterium]